MYEAAFNRIERELRNEAGIANELDYVEQISWVLFLKYLDDLEITRRGSVGRTAVVGAKKRGRQRRARFHQTEPARLRRR